MGMSSWDKTEALEDGSVIRRNCVFPLVLADSLANSPQHLPFFLTSFSCKGKIFFSMDCTSSFCWASLSSGEEKQRKRCVGAKGTTGSQWVYFQNVGIR